MHQKLGLLFLCVSTLAVAATPSTYLVKCGVTKYSTQGEADITANVVGLVTGRSKTRFYLQDYSIRYTVYTDGEVWTKETIRGTYLVNDASYKPTKYRNHVRFALPSERGNVELIYPSNLGNRKKFSAYLVFSYINDHFGGTARVYCTKTTVN